MVRFQADADFDQVIVAAVLRRHMSVSTVVDELLLIASVTSPDDWTNRICYLPL